MIPLDLLSTVAVAAGYSTSNLLYLHKNMSLWYAGFLVDV